MNIVKIDLIKSVCNKTKIVSFAVFVFYIAAVSYLLHFSLTHKVKAEMPVDVFSLQSLYAQQDENGWYIVGSLDIGDIEEINLIYGPYLSLDRGSYTLAVDYDNLADQTLLVTANDIKWHYIKANPVILDKNQHHLEYDFEVREPLDNLETVFHYNGEGNYRISKVSVFENYNLDLRRWFIIVSLPLLLLIGFWIYQSDRSRQRTIMALAGVVTLCSIPLMFPGVNLIGGQDAMFHLLRVDGIVSEWRNGHFPAYISSLWLGGYGYPVSVYYGDIFLTIPVAFRLLGISVSSSYKLFVIIINCITVYISYRSFRSIFKDKNLSVLLTLVYATSCYRLTNVYTRSAVGEYIGMIFLPMIAAIVFRVFRKEGSVFRNAIYLAFAMSGILTSHLLTTIMACITLVIVSILFIKDTLRSKAVLVYSIGAVFTVLFSLYFLVPFLDYFMNVQVGITESVADGHTIIQHRGLSLADLFVFYRGDGEILTTPGIVLMSLIPLMIYMIVMHAEVLDRTIVKVMILSFMFIVATMNFFPWDHLCRILRVFNIAATVQFPWRYLTIAVLMLTILLGLLLGRADLSILPGLDKDRLMRIAGILCVVSVLLFTAAGAQGFRLHTIYDIEEMDTYNIMAGEYELTNENEFLMDGRVHSDHADVAIIGENTDGHRMVVSCHCDADSGENAVIEFPVYAYKGIVVLDEEGNDVTDLTAESPLLTASLNPTYDGNLYVDYNYPGYWTIALAVSAVAFIIILMYLLIRSGIAPLHQKCGSHAK